MRHKGLINSATDACRLRAGPSHLAQHNAAGPSRIPLSALAPSCLPFPPPPPISTPSPSTIPSQPSSSSSSTTAASLPSTSASTVTHSAPRSQNKRRDISRHSILSQHLPFLYPPSCLELTRTPSTRSKSSLAPTSSVAAAAAPAQQLATAHDDHRDHHLSSQLEPDFTFLRHHYDPPHHLIDHPPSHALLQQDADSHFEQEQSLHLPGQETLPPSIQSHAQDQYNASVAALQTLRRKSRSLRRSLQDGQITDPETIVKQCRRLVLQSCRISSRLHATSARAIACEIASDCAVYLAAAAHPVAAASVLRHLLVKVGWNPRSISYLDLSSSSDSSATPKPTDSLASTGSSSSNTTTSATTSTSAARLWFITQQLISQLTLAPCSFSPRPVRRFESQQHLDAATSLVSAMHLSHMARSTASQTSMIRAMIASGQPRLAVQTFAAEVRAWWAAHRQANRPRSSLRRQAALVAEVGKPSSQALREITRALQNLEQLLSRVRSDLLSQLSELERHALQAKRAEYADSLVELIRLVRGGRLPLPRTPSAPEIAWILSACCRFEATVLLNEIGAKQVKPMPPSNRNTQNRKLQHAAQVIRYYLAEYMHSLPDGHTRSAGNLLIRGEPVIRPALGTEVYNQLIHYALSVLHAPSVCKDVFQHMTQLRQPPLEPDSVTFNTILRQATTQRYESLARAVLTTKRPEHSQTASSTATPGSETASAEAELQTIRPMIQQIDNAIAQADSYRLVSLLQYVTASGLFLRRYRHEPGHLGVKELVMRIYPALNKQRFRQSRIADSLASQGSPAHQDASTPLRPKANQASRHAILNPHVLTATLNLAAKAGKTGLALRIWRLIKRTSLQSALQSPHADVAKTPWKIPVEAATILMSVLASEAAKAPKARHPLRLQRQRLSLGASRIAARRLSRFGGAGREYTRGWNIGASQRGRASARGSDYVGHTHDRNGESGEGLRWRVAQLLSKREYAFLVHHWQLSQRLTSSRRQQLEKWLQMGKKGKADRGVQGSIADVEDETGVRPDSRFYDALLDVFGRRAGMIQRSRRYRSRSEVMSQLRRGYKEAVARASSSEVGEAQGGQPAVGKLKESSSNPTLRLLPIDKMRALSTNQLLTALVARINWNSRGRYTSAPPDPFLVRILLDMQALNLDIPVGYRWILAHSSIAASLASEHAIPEALQNEAAEAGGSKKQQGAFSPFRGPRIKTVGLIARRRSVGSVGSDER